jgi:hypothetical protein
MNLREGFTIEDPALMVPWNITDTKLIEIGGSNGLCKVSRGYYAASYTALGGLQIELGFHFEPRSGGRLKEIEIFRKFPKPLNVSFQEFQAHLERTFGAPTQAAPGSEGLPDYEWRVPGAVIHHYVFDRFGPEKHARIKKK